MKTRKAAMTVVFVLWMILTTLVLFEVAVRVTGYSSGYIYDPIYMPYSQTDGIPFVHKPGLDNARARGLIRINTDGLGLRSKHPGTADPAPKAPNEFRIAVAGDSFTFGDGIERCEDTYVCVMEDHLNDHADERVFRAYNFGVSAYSVKEMAHTLSYRIPEVAPDLAVMAIIPDDFDLSRTCEVDKYGYAHNPKLSGFLDKDSIIKRLARNVHSVYFVRDMWYRRARKKGEHHERTMRIAEKLPESYGYVLRFRDRAQESGLHHLIVLLPTLRGDFGDIVRDRMREDNVEYLDLTFIRREFNAGDFKVSKYNRHPSAEVHKRIGEELAEYILERFQSGVY